MGFLYQEITYKKKIKKKIAVATYASADIDLVLENLPRELKHSTYYFLIFAVAVYGRRSPNQGDQEKCSVLTASSRTGIPLRIVFQH